uniref:Uncharacterized protein n=1 Tax=Anguilla anguilla TaxID=7936 RepID=A0A0E9WV98_ANGAN
MNGGVGVVRLPGRPSDLGPIVSNGNLRPGEADTNWTYECVHYIRLNTVRLPFIQSKFTPNPTTPVLIFFYPHLLLLYQYQTH